MISGLNDNILYKNREFHIQTEDGGPRVRVITSQIFHRGAVVASRRTDYSDLPDTAESLGPLRQLMARQHKDLRDELLAGKLDAAID